MHHDVKNSRGLQVGRVWLHRPVLGSRGMLGHEGGHAELTSTLQVQKIEGAVARFSLPPWPKVAVSWESHGHTALPGDTWPLQDPSA